MGFFDDMDFGKITPAEPEDYSLDINNKTIFQDSRFLNDLREHYQETGESVDDDHELLKKFYSDRLWGDINTPSALYQAYKAQDASVDQRARMNRLQRVYEAMPISGKTVVQQTYLVRVMLPVRLGKLYFLTRLTLSVVSVQPELAPWQL